METSTAVKITIHQRIGAALAAVAIGLGAFGSHGLESRLETAGMMEAWRTAVFYHLIHAVCIYFLASMAGAKPSRGLSLTMNLWIAGVILFSGSLYGLALTSWGILGPITPIGGLCLIAGWIVALGAKLIPSY